VLTTFCRSALPACLVLGCNQMASSPNRLDGGGASDAALTAVRSGSAQPANATVDAGRTLQLTATATPKKYTSFTWTSSNRSVATVSSTGLVTGVAAGQATITAAVEGTSGAATITVRGGSVPVASVTVTSVPPSGGSAQVLAAGDIASCGHDRDEQTAQVVDRYPGLTLLTLGDNVYPDGTASQFANCYDPTWGRHKARTRPAPGNHDYHTAGASGYYGYFGANAGPSGRGYYSYDLGSWHIVSLNSSVSMSRGSAQEQWLRADLAASTKQCTLAYWHHPRFSSGTKHGNFSAAQPIWQALYDYNADVVLSGHEHNYERFAPQTATGSADPVRGIRQFVVGTGGAGNYSGHSAIANSQVFNGTTFGVLKLALAASSYSWQFLPVAGQSFSDSGTGSCH
jgi:acid phosphatase type 7